MTETFEKIILLLQKFIVAKELILTSISKRRDVIEVNTKINISNMSLYELVYLINELTDSNVQPECVFKHNKLFLNFTIKGE